MEAERAAGYYKKLGRIFEEESPVPGGMQEMATRGRNLARKRHAFFPESVGWLSVRVGAADA